MQKLIKICLNSDNFFRFSNRRSGLCNHQLGLRGYFQPIVLCAPISTISSGHVADSALINHFSFLAYNKIKLVNKLNKQRSIAQSRSMSSSIISNNNSDSKDEEALRQKYEPKERRFKTVYGHIAGLEWGNPDNHKKILCIHGWLDNAGSFERLIPFILDHGDNASKYHIVAIDHPGCGNSSHKPPGAQYTMFTTIIEMRRVVKDLGWDRLSLLSHSMGSQLSFLFSCLYPYQVTSLISIDLPHPLTAGLKNWAPIMVSSIEEQLKMEEVLTDDPTTSIQVPVYSREDAIKRLMDGHSNSLTRESAEVMLKRGARKEQWGYTFNRDLRHRIMYVEFRLDYDLLRKYMVQFFNANLFVIIANQSVYHIPEDIIETFNEIFRKNCRLFETTKLDGTHHLHMNNPDRVAVKVCEFLEKIENQEVEDATNSGGGSNGKSKL